MELREHDVWGIHEAHGGTTQPSREELRGADCHYFKFSSLGVGLVVCRDCGYLHLFYFGSEGLASLVSIELTMRYFDNEAPDDLIAHYTKRGVDEMKHYLATQDR
jgi:hypothetical protein